MRLSVTDRCNLRCFYCMPREGIPLAPREEILTFEEMERVASILSSLGVKHIRITGGEPLVRRGLERLVLALSKMAVDLSLTTNGVLLSSFAGALKRAGLRRVNISLDTLRRERFKRVTGRDLLPAVLEGIEAALEVGLRPVKLNVVVMRGVNDDEVGDFVRFALERGLVLRFIELMRSTPLWREDLFVPVEEVRRFCEREFGLKELGPMGPGPAVYYEVGGGGVVGFIKASEENCSRCGRLRLSATGRLRVCLFEPDGLDLKPLLRGGASDEEIKAEVERRLWLKRGRTFRDWSAGRTLMCQVGG